MLSTSLGLYVGQNKNTCKTYVIDFPWFVCGDRTRILVKLMLSTSLGLCVGQNKNTCKTYVIDFPWFVCGTEQ